MAGSRRIPYVSRRFSPPAGTPAGGRPAPWRCPVLGPVLLAAARSAGVRRLVSSTPVTRPVVDRYIAGERLDDAVAAVRALTGRGLEVTLDHLGEDITDPAEALRNRDAYLALCEALAALGLGERAEMSVKLSAFGQALPGGHDL